MNTSPRTIAEKAGYKLDVSGKVEGDGFDTFRTYAYFHPTTEEGLLIDVTPTPNSNLSYSYDWAHHDKNGEVLGTGRDGEDLRRYFLRKLEKEIEKLESIMNEFPEDSEPTPETKCPSCKRLARLGADGFCDQC